MQFDKIAVIDFGGQYAHLIATKVRRLKVLCEIKDPQDPVDSFREYRGIIISGSPALASAGEDSEYSRGIYNLDVPILGFCFGHQEIAKHYGGAVEHTQREYGPADLHVQGSSAIFRGLGPVERVWMSHGDTVTRLPEGFEELGQSAVGRQGKRHPNAAIGSDRHRRWGFQFHPEVDDTVNGSAMLRNFVVDICGARPDWTMDNFVGQIREDIRARVGGRHVLLLASGGVDSTVTARLLAEALGPERLYLLHVDNGLLREGESRSVLAELESLGLGAALHFLDASREFVERLKGVTEPEEKRRIIGDTFIEVTQREARRLDLEHFVLGQGTIYPDRIETGGTKRADRIKTHHNRVPVIERMIEEGRVVEPIAELYKTEVRELGQVLGIPRSCLVRHPFPGPGLAVRILCSHGVPLDTPDRMREELAKALAGTGQRGHVLPVRSVGVKADLRSYERPVLLEGPGGGHDELVETAARLFKEVHGVNRAVAYLGAGPVERIDAVPAYLTRERLDLLRALDAWMMQLLGKHGQSERIWQCPTVLVNVSLNGRGAELVVLRPVLSERGMTACPASLPRELVQEFLDRAARCPEVSGVALDVTTKPPGTIEWE